jgi:hypothetical protein
MATSENLPFFFTGDRVEWKIRRKENWPMYFFDWQFNRREMWRGVIRRSIDLLQRVGHEILRPEEAYAAWLDSDGLGVWIEVVSPRPEELLKSIKREVFPSFAFLGMSTGDGQTYWTHFRAM